MATHVSCHRGDHERVGGGGVGQAGLTMPHSLGTRTGLHNKFKGIKATIINDIYVELN